MLTQNTNKLRFVIVMIMKLIYGFNLLIIQILQHMMEQIKEEI